MDVIDRMEGLSWPVLFINLELAHQVLDYDMRLPLYPSSGLLGLFY